MSLEESSTEEDAAEASSMFISPDRLQLGNCTQLGGVSGYGSVHYLAPLGAKAMPSQVTCSFRPSDSLLIELRILTRRLSDSLQTLCRSLGNLQADGKYGFCYSR